MKLITSALWLLAGLIQLQPNSALASDPCSVLLNVKQAVAGKPADGAPMSEWSQYEQNITIAATGSANKIRERYFQRAWTARDSEALKPCLSEDLMQRVSYSLRDSFFQGSVQDLVKSKGHKARLADLISSGKFEMFRLVGHLKPEQADPGSGSGGFHRGRRSIFMDFTKIDPKDWLLIFSHEIIHSVDSVLKTAVDIFGSLAVSKKVNQMSRDFSDPQALSKDDRAALDTWLVAAYDRGFFAEVRAWAVTIALYQEGRKDGTFVSLPWMEDILKKKKQGESIQDFTTRFLDPNFYDPKDGQFAAPLVQKEIKVLREQIRNGQRKIVFGQELLDLL